MYVNILPIDGVGTTLGSTVILSRIKCGNYTYTSSGNISFDIADVNNLVANGTFYYVVLHEMAHLLGFGSLWVTNRVYTNNSGKFKGLMATSKWNTEFGQIGNPAVELEGSPGTANGHWNENLGGVGPVGITSIDGDDMQNELMTGWLNSPVFISDMTIASFEDIGYNINLANNIYKKSSNTLTQSSNIETNFQISTDNTPRQCRCIIEN